MSRTKILIIDDDPAISALFRVYLERTELYQVAEVNRPAEALATARDFRPDAMLLDVFMPGMDGRALAREMGKDPLLCEVPVMFITTHIFQKEAREHEVIRAGMPFLAKSNDANVLVESVGRLVLGVHNPMPADRGMGRVDS
jgi:CheY-like chemotaxis protein